MAKVLITGGSGLVGQRLAALLEQRGYQIHILSRSRSGERDGRRYFKWSIENGFIEEGALDTDHIVHLAGAGVADKKWTQRRKREITDSRVQSTRLLADSLVAAPGRVKSMVSASAVGYYGNRGGEILNEDATPGNDFLAGVCRQWETEANQIGERCGLPVGILRIGIVLSKDGGALPKIAGPVRFGVSAILGNGKQYYPWIHIDDLCSMIIHAMENRLEGVYNAAAPDPVPLKELVKALARVLGRPFIPAPTPEFILKIAMGEMAAMVLNGQRTSADKILASGYSFNYDELDEALASIYR